MITDLNKKLNGSTGIDITSGGAITYNYLNLPWQIPVKADNGGDKGTITYTYDAAGSKLKKVVADNSTSGKTITTTTSYVGGLVYESKTTSPANTPNDDYTDRLQFIGHEEGRIRYITAEGTTAAHFEYDYFVKDHLGNVRMVLTEEQKQDVYPAATLEGDIATSTSAAIRGHISTGYFLMNNTIMPVAVLIVSVAMGLLKIITIQLFLLSRLPGTGTFLYIAATRVRRMCSLITCRLYIPGGLCWKKRIIIRLG
jgi:hypothetical protein